MKKKEDLRIVYMGTPEFAVESLKCLVEGGYNVVGVVTMPDKPMGRHQDVLQASPVKQYAVEHGLRVLQPVKLKDEAFVEELRSLRADLQIVVAFRMLPEVVWNMQPARVVVATIPWGRPHQLGSHQRRNGNGHHHVLPQT